MRLMNSNRNKNISRKGFTLSELLISVGLMAFVATTAIGGLVVLNHTRDVIERQNQAEMIMIATVNYLRKDLDACTDPFTMDCSKEYYPMSNSTSAMGPDFFQLESSEGRYTNVIIRDKDFNTVATTTCDSPLVQYWNSTNDPDNLGICVGYKYSNVAAPTLTDPTSGIKISDYFSTKDYSNRKYIIAQNIMQGTDMYSIIGDGTLDVGQTYAKGKMVEEITWNNTEKMFQFWVYVIDENTKEVIMKQYVEVCPDTLLPKTNTSNP